MNLLILLGLIVSLLVWVFTLVEYNRVFWAYKKAVHGHMEAESFALRLLQDVEYREKVFKSIDKAKENVSKSKKIKMIVSVADKPKRGRPSKTKK